MECESDDVISMNQRFAMAGYPDYDFYELYILTLLFATKFNRSWDRINKFK